MSQPAGQTRREFVRQASLAALASASSAAAPWYRRCLRWGQTNINEFDPQQYDIDWWRAHWKRTHTQGVIINAGGIVAYYPSKFNLHYRARYLGTRDLYGELARAAHQDGLAVLARMDSNRAHEDFYRAHPDWFAVDREGRPYRAGELYLEFAYEHVALPNAYERHSYWGHSHYTYDQEAGRARFREDVKHLWVSG